MISDTLLDEAKAVVKLNTATQFYMDVVFVSSDPTSKFEFSPLQIEDGSLYADPFDTDFSTNFYLEFMLSPHDGVLLAKYKDSLLATLTFTYCDSNGNEDLSRPPFQKQYRVMLAKAILQMAAQIPEADKLTTPTYKVNVLLIDKSVYDMRLTKINAILPKCTVKDAIYYMAKSFGIQKIHMTEPDNTHVYDHIPLLDCKGIDEAFGLLQKNYGVYLKGMSYYIKDGVLFIYPPFETNPKFSKTMSLYQMDKGRYSGLLSLHKKESNNNLSIVVTDDPKMVSLAQFGSENVGTGFQFNRASRSAGGLTTVDSNTGSQFTESSTVSLEIDDPDVVDKGKKNTVHIGITDNPYPKASQIASFKASIIQVFWKGSDPLIIDPDYFVRYNYDLNGTMVTATGQIESSSTWLVFQGRQGNRNKYYWTTRLTLRVTTHKSD